MEADFFFNFFFRASWRLKVLPTNLFNLYLTADGISDKLKRQREGRRERSVREKLGLLLNGVKEVEQSLVQSISPFSNEKY